MNDLITRELVEKVIREAEADNAIREERHQLWLANPTILPPWQESVLVPPDLLEKIQAEAAADNAAREARHQLWLAKRAI